MKLIIVRIKDFFPFLNKRAITESDLYAVIKNLKIRLYRIPLKVNGYYIAPEKSLNKKPCIYINSNLNRFEEFINTIHEVIHHILHISYGHSLFSRPEDDPQYKTKEYYFNKQEREARFLTAILLMPEKEFEASHHLPVEEQNEIFRYVYLVRREAKFEWNV